MKTEEPSLLDNNRARALKKIFRSLLSGNCVRVLGPRFTGKSELVRQAADEARRELYSLVSYHSMADYKQENWPDFFSLFYQHIARDILPGRSAAASAAAEKVECRAPIDLQSQLLNLLQQCDRNVILFIDNLEIAPPNLIASLLGVIRAVFNTRAGGSGLRFQAVVCGSLSFSQLALPHVSRFESISDLVLVGDLDPSEREERLRALCSAAGIEASEDGLAAFLDYSGGDRYLIRRLFTLVKTELEIARQVKLTRAVVESAAQDFRRRARELATQEIIRQIESEPNLLSCALQILDQGRVPARDVQLPSLETPNLLDLSGVFIREGDGYRTKCRLWEQILAERLSHARVGRLYALAGSWPQAIHYLALASAAQEDVKLDLFNATINAMHASANGREALLYLARGLQGLYPGIPFRIYERTAAALVQVFPEEAEPEEILLARTSQPEIEALRGPDYSAIFDPARTRFLFPLRLRSSAEPLALLSLGEPFNRFLLEGHQEEIYQLIGFLRQAARAVEARDTYAALLADAQSRAEKQHNLNEILTRILDRYDLPDEAVLRLVMAGVTAGLCLEFNRAVLFLYDEKRKALVAQIGVGHLSRQEADEDWTRNVPTTLPELIEALLVPNYRYSPLHRKIQGLAIPTGAASRNLFARTMADQEPRVSRRQVLLEGLPQSFIDATGGAETFALVPFNAGSQMQGLLYVDNRFTQRDITDERVFLLRSFMNQAALVIKLAWALKAEQQRTTLMAELLRAEEAINDQITKQVQGVLDQIAARAHRLFHAKSAVLYTFGRPSGDGQTGYFTDQIVYKGTDLDHSTDGLPSPERGMTYRVIQQGFVHIPDIEQARLASENEAEEVWQNSFVQQEQVRSSIGVRLGTRDEPEGVLYLNWDAPHPLSEEDQAMITIFASFAAVTIPSARRHQQVQEDLQRRMREMEGLSQLIRAGVELWSEEEIEAIIQQALQTTLNLTEVNDLWLLRRGPRSQYQQYRLSGGGKLEILALDQVADEQSAQVFLQEKPVGKYTPADGGVYWPIQVGGNVLGVLWMETGQQSTLVEKHDAYLDHLCNRLALTFHQAEVYQALSKLFQAALRMTQDIDREDFLDDFMQVLVSEALESVWSVDTITSYYIDKDLETLKVGPYAGLWDKSSIKKSPPDSSDVVVQVLNASGPIFEENVLENRSLNGTFVQREQIKSAAAFPLRVGEKRVGSIFFSYRHYQKFDPGEKSLLNLFAQLAAIAINYARLLEDARRQKKRLETVAKIAENLVAAGPDLDAIYRNLFREVLQVVPRADNACIIQRDPDGEGYFIVPASIEFYRTEPQIGQDTYRVPKDTTGTPRGIAIRVIETGEPRLANDVSQDKDYIRAVPTSRAEVCAPIELDGQPHAAILLESDQRDAFTQDDLLLLTALAPIISIAIQRVQQMLRARERAELEKMGNLAIGLVHEITRAVANIPDLVEEIRASVANVEPVNEECLDDLERNAIQTKRVSAFVRELGTMGYFNPKPDRLEPVIEKVVAEASQHLPASCQVLYQRGQPLPMLTIHAELIEILLKNIIENALRAIPPNRSGLIEIRTEVSPAGVAISVQDNGTGIAEDDQSKVLEQPFTTKEDRTQMHGVGLWLCNQIAEIHKGKLEFSTRPDDGTTFIVRLPL